MAKRNRTSLVRMAGALLLFAARLGAQIHYGDITATANGTLSPGYSATYGNTVSSTHNWIVGGSGALSGSYYSPNFLSFNIAPYVNESSANSNYRSTSNASGVSASANIFSGSHFPGAVNFSRSYDAEGSYNLPGVANYVTHGNSTGMGVTWSESIPDAPSLSLGYQRSTGDYTVYGSSSNGNSDYQSLMANSGYMLGGFQMSAFASVGDNQSLIPSIVTGETNSKSQNTNNSYGVAFSHRLPMSGMANMNLRRSNWDFGYLTFHNTGTVDTLNATATLLPTKRLGLSANLSYSDNLAGELLQQITSANGSAVSSSIFNQSSDSTDFTTQASYAAEKNLNAMLLFEHRNQHYDGQSYGQDSVGGGLGFFHKVPGGTFNASGFISGNVSETNGDGTMGVNATANYAAVLHGWDVDATFGYAQNMETLLVTYTTSSYNFGGNARRRLGAFRMGLGAAGSHSGLTQQPDSSNESQSYHANLSYKSAIMAAGTYSEASGQALLTGGGAVIVNPIPSSLVGLFGGHSWSGSLTASPKKGLLMSATYGSSRSDNTSSSVTTANRSSELNSLVQYQVRKLNFLSGFSRLNQSFSTSGTTPEVLSSFYIGVSRWFNFF